MKLPHPKHPIYKAIYKVNKEAINILGSEATQPFLFDTVVIEMFYLMPIPLAFSITHNISIPRHSGEAFEDMEGS